MSRRAVYHLAERIAIAPETLTQLRAACTPSSKTAWVSTSERLRVHTLRGVPGKHVDLLLPDHDSASLVLEVGRKAGCYDGRERWRLTVRSWERFWVSHPDHPDSRPSQKFPDPRPARVILEEHDAEMAVICLWQPSGMWAQQFPMLRYQVEPGSDRRAILLWQWTHHYRFLPGDDVRQLAEYWSLLPAIQSADDLVYLNREAGAALYDLAKLQGWKKLTLRDKQRYGFDPDGPQWQRCDHPNILRWHKQRSDVGEYTQRAALNDQEYVRTAHGQIIVE